MKLFEFIKRTDQDENIRQLSKRLAKFEQNLKELREEGQDFWNLKSVFEALPEDEQKEIAAVIIDKAMSHLSRTRNELLEALQGNE